MGQNQCNICQKHKIDEISIINNTNESDSNMIKKKNSFDGDLFSKKQNSSIYSISEIKDIRDLKAKPCSLKLKYVNLTQKQASIVIQAFYRGVNYRRFFNSKIKVRMKIESIKLVEAVKQNLTPEKIKETLAQLMPFEDDRYIDKNKSNKLIMAVSSNHFSSNNNLKSNKIESESFGPYLILYYNKETKIKDIKDNKDIGKSDLLTANYNFINTRSVNKSTYTDNNHKGSLNAVFVTNSISHYCNYNGGKNQLGRQNTRMTVNTERETICTERPQFISEMNKEFYQRIKSYYYGSVNIKNQRHGFGIFISQDGKFYEGKWVKNSFEGYGRVIDNKGLISEGNFLI